MNAYQMLLILGFPPAVAEASAAPEIFLTEADDKTDTGEPPAATSPAGARR